MRFIKMEAGKPGEFRRIGLEQGDDGSIRLVDMDSSGDANWVLLTLQADGTVFLHSSIEDDAYKTDKDGCIKIVKS